MIKYLLLLAFLVGNTLGFAPEMASRRASVSLHANLATPTFNKATEKWEKAPSDDGEYPYGPVGALLRHGPAPFIARLTNPDDFEQAVLKYMAVAKVDRSEATGNMDAKLNNAADWAYAKMEEKRGRPKVDYTKLDKKQAALTTVWGLFSVPMTYYVVSSSFSQAMSH